MSQMAAGANSASTGAAPFVLSQSEAAVVSAIRKLGPLSRTDLARETGYSRAKITSIVGGLIEGSVLEELGEGESQGGRRPRLLDFGLGLAYVAGIDIGVTSLDLALADLRGRILERHSEAADVNNGPDAVLSRANTLLVELLGRRGVLPGQLYAVGIGVPAPVEFSTGLILGPPMPDWEAYPVRHFINQTFPAAEVVADNDANIMALGEMDATAKGVDSFIFIKVGTGIGAGIICNGEIYRGNSGCAGEVGHICVDRDGPVCPRCGNVGCLEAMAAGPAIARRAMEAAQMGRSRILANQMEAGDNSLTAEDVGAAAIAGDRVSIEIIQDSGRLIGEALAGIVSFFNPGLILIGGGVSNIRPQLLSSIRQAVLRRSHPRSTENLHIEYSGLGSEAGVTGAISLALERVFVVDGTRN
jgi:glucokinase-like ROK family protein